MKPVSRRDFLKYGLSGAATIAIGSKLDWLGSSAMAATQTLDITITDALKDMVTHNAVNTAQCYFWIYKMTADGVDIPAEYPGPTILATSGDTISITVTNSLDEPHALYIPGMLDTGPIAADGGTYTGEFTVGAAGAHLYYDNLNAPVNRVMGLHGALVVMPAAAQAGHKWTPYDNPTPAVQKLFDDFGSSAHFPGLAWEEGDSSPWAHDPSGNTPNCPPFRQYVWLTHEASPALFEEVGSLAPGVTYDAEAFVQAITQDPFSPTGDNRIPKFWMINGQSGAFAHMSPTITPMGRVGEPVVVHILNAGLVTYSMHLHANHFYVSWRNGTVWENPWWLDVYQVHSMDRVDYVVPFMRPPDVGTVRGIGLPETPLTTINGHPCWPPIEEMDMYLPPALPDPNAVTAFAQDGVTVIDLKQRMSPLCFPMHDHSEPSQTAQGGNYNCGLISGMYFTGDRNTPGHMDFPMDEDFHMLFRNIRGLSGTNVAAGPWI